MNDTFGRKLSSIYTLVSLRRSFNEWRGSSNLVKYMNGWITYYHYIAWTNMKEVYHTIDSVIKKVSRGISTTLCSLITLHAYNNGPSSPSQSIPHL